MMADETTGARNQYLNLFCHSRRFFLVRKVVWFEKGNLSWRELEKQPATPN